MATYVFNGQTYHLPDDVSDEDAIGILTSLTSQNEPSQAPEEAQQATTGAVAEEAAAPAPEAAPMVSPDDAMATAPAEPNTSEILNQEKGEVNPDLLVNDPTYMKAARIYYGAKSKEVFQGSDQELVDWSLSEMSDFNYNIARGAVTSLMLNGMDDTQKASFGYMMDTTDRLEYTWAGAGRATKAVLTDPTTYIGVATLGAGLFGKAAGKVLTKEAVKAMIRPQTLRASAIIGAAEGGIWGATGDSIRQSAEVQVNPGQEFSTGRMLAAGGIGAAGGAALVGAVGGTAKLASGLLPSAPNTPNVGRLNLPEAQPLPPQAAPGVPSAMPETALGPNGTPTPGQGLSALDGASPAAVDAVSPANPLSGVRLNEGAQDVMNRIVTKDAPINVRAIADNFNPEAPAGKAAMEAAQTDLANISKVVDIEDFQQAFAKADPEGAIAGRVMEAVRRIAPDGTVANLPSSYKDLRQVVDPVIDQLTEMNLKPTMLTDIMARAAASPEQATVIKASVNSAANILTEVQTRLTRLVQAGNKEAEQTLQRIAPLQSALADLDSTMGSASGSELGYRAGGLLTGDNKGLSADNVLLEKGINPEMATVEQFREANFEMLDRIEKRTAEIMKSKRVQNLNKQVDMALKGNDLDRAMDIMDEIEAVKDMVQEKDGLIRRSMSNSIDMFNELATAGALSTGTLGINMVYPTVKMITTPAIQAIFKGGGEAARKEAIVGYTALLAARKRAWATFKMFAEYEQQILREAGKNTYEYKSTLPGRIGQKYTKNIPGLRKGIPVGDLFSLIPKILGASDQFMRTMMYESEVAAEAAYNAVIKAQEKGLKGRAKKEFINKMVKETSEAGLKNVAMSEEAISMFRKQGINNGLTGDALRQHVKNMIDTKGHLINEPTNQRIMKRVIKDTFGTEWDDKGLESMLKALDQRFNNEWKLLRTTALFMRPTYMIFRAGLEYTPGAQLFVKDFRKALTGSMGETEMVRAHMKLFAGYAMMMGTIGMFVNGNISGAGDPDYKKVRNMKDAGFEPYNMNVGGGINLGYRNLDPISTPIKITANFMEAAAGIENSRMLEPDKDFNSGTMLEHGAAGLFAFIQAVKDANLGQGIQQAFMAVDEMFDPEGDGMKAGAKFFAEKIKTVWPNSLSRMARYPLFGAGDDAIEPRTFSQTLLARIWPSWKSIPRQYDILGNTRKITMGPLSLFAGIDLDRNTGSSTKYSPEEQAVVTKLTQIERQTGAALTLPRKKEPFDVDLREVNTTGGLTFHDAWNQELNKDPNLTRDLYREIVQNPYIPVGNKDHDGWAAKRAKQLINDARNRAWERLIAREFPAQDLRNRNAKMKWLSEKGLRETPPTHYNQ